MPDHPPYKEKDVVDRLIKENEQYRKILSEIKIEIEKNKELEGFTIVGGVKALIKKYHDSQKKVWDQEKEIKSLKKEN